MKIVLLLMLSILTHSTYASYINSCDLVVKLLEDTTVKSFQVYKEGFIPNVDEKHLISFKGLVKKASVADRADSDCQHYMGTVLKNSFFYPHASFKAKKGQKIKINVLIKDFRETSKSNQVTYSILITLLEPKSKTKIIF